jgi:hypothetical protein
MVLDQPLKLSKLPIDSLRHAIMITMRGLQLISHGGTTCRPPSVGNG